jgi:N-acetylneuraminic acid mutarotase
VSDLDTDLEIAGCYNHFNGNIPSLPHPWEFATMFCTYRTLLAVIALNVPLVGRTDEPPGAKTSSTADAWPILEWKKAAPSPFARVESPTAVVNGKIYLFGGFTEDLDASNRVDVYDPASDSWSRKKDMPAHLTHLNPALDGNTIWFAGGFKGKHPGPVTAEVWKYDIAADSWTGGPPLPERRAGGGLAVVERKLHYFGGYKTDRDTNAGDHWSLSLDGGKDWQHEADLPDPRGHVSAAVLDGKIYALGGDHGHDKTQIDVKSCHRFDPATKKWSEIASLPDGRSHFESSTIVYKDRILIVGGRCNSSQPPRNVVDDLLQYDPKADSWDAVGTMPEKLLAPAAAVISGRIVVIGGGQNNPRPLTAITRIASLTDDK